MQEDHLDRHARSQGPPAINVRENGHVKSALQDCTATSLTITQKVSLFTVQVSAWTLRRRLEYHALFTQWLLLLRLLTLTTGPAAAMVHPATKLNAKRRLSDES
ncbi:hypothetical protein TNCV_2926171 [Trichonephila clavipes]|nr:hypothetical protein TNCV_2926171 [Trichonephila clavipes]